MNTVLVYRSASSHHVHLPVTLQCLERGGRFH